MNNIYNFLGLAFRANKVITGESVLKGIRSKRVDLVIIASDASENTKKKYIDKCIIVVYNLLKYCVRSVFYAN